MRSELCHISLLNTPTTLVVKRKMYSHNIKPALYESETVIILFNSDITFK
jgi:hypothetical protein